MTPSLASLLIALVAFAIAFGIAKFFATRRQRRKRQQEQEVQFKAQSRQVRRARSRKGGR